MITSKALQPVPAPQPLPPTRAFPPLVALRAFDAVVRLGSIGLAAEALSVNRSMINGHLRRLETWTGATLIRRVGQDLVLTEEGRRYHDMLAPHLDGLASATLTLLEPRRDDRLSIWSMPGFATLWLMPRLDGFRRAHPGLSLDLRGDEAAPNFSRHDADLAIRYTAEYGTRYVPSDGRLAELPTNVRILELARTAVFPVASPDYLARSPAIRQPSDLLAHTLIDEEGDSWRPWFAKFGIHDAPTAPGLKLWQTDLALGAARRGQGVALANHFAASDDIAAGRLVEVSGSEGAFPSVLFGSYLLIARPDRWHARPVARFRHWIVQAIRSELESAGSRAS